MARPCVSCGKPTKREGGICIGPACGWNAYLWDLRLRKKTAAAKELAVMRVANAEEIARDERDRVAEEALEELADALAGLSPWPSWMSSSQDEFEAEGARQSDLQAQDRERLAVEAALLEAIAVMEKDAAAAREREVATEAQLSRLRAVYAAQFDMRGRDISPP